MRYILSVCAIALLALQSCTGNSTETVEADGNAPEKTNEVAAGAKKYQIKSASIKFENKATAAGINIIETAVVYFDDYGRLERKDTYDQDGNLKESFFSDGSDLYTLIHEDKKAFKVGKAVRGTEFKFDWNEVSAEDKQNGKAKQAPNEMIAGKDCEAFLMETDAGKSKFAGWKNICMLTEVNSPHVQSVSRAVEIKEELVDAKLFTVPEGYSLEKTNF